MSEAATQTQPDLSPDVVDALQIQSGEQSLVVPMSAVAEVVRGISVQSRDGQQDWLQGWINWRDLDIPLVAIDHLMGGAKPVQVKTLSALVLSTIGSVKGQDFFAIPLTDLPSPARLSSSAEIAKAKNQSGYEMLTVKIGEQLSVVPDLEKLEGFLKKNL
ncbi:MAG: chemotaxis protein CheW [bacterium]